MIPFPVRALLRNKATVTLRGICNLGKEFAPEIYVVGHVDTNQDAYQKEVCNLEMWRKDGKWRYEGGGHSLDIVGFINPNGTVRPLTNELQ